jgi:hypothetical protein
MTEQETEQFEIKIMELLGPLALTNGKMSFYECAKIFWKAGVNHSRQSLKCQHEPYQGACIHCGVRFENGIPKFGVGA